AQPLSGFWVHTQVATVGFKLIKSTIFWRAPAKRSAYTTGQGPKRAQLFIFIKYEYRAYAF
ncbi:MAG: hypothetical protein ACREBW_06455, partial [Candidatus Micrarchaeaceae archaeon]